MKRFLIKGIVAGLSLTILNGIALLAMVWAFPGLAKEYFSPVFHLKDDRALFYFLHPFVVSFALAWFWRRFKTIFHGNFLMRGLEVGFAYAAIAVIPSMWMIFSAFAVSTAMVITWLIYGIVQGMVVGIIYARISP